MCAALTGIESNKYTIIAFVMAGLGVGLGAFLTLVYTPSVTTTTASSIGMNIFIAIVFGGMAYFRRSTFQNLCGTGWRFFLYPAQ